MKLLLIIIYLNSLIIANDINNFFQKKEENHDVYKLCKRPISINFIKKDIPELEQYNSNLVHFQFFKLDNEKQNVYSIKHRTQFKISFITQEQNKTIHINKSCMKNHFSNFGYFDDTSINCNENIEDYTYCSDSLYNKQVLENSLNDLVNDFKYKKYKLLNYNCQVFARNLIKIYNVQKNDIFEHEGKCYTFDYFTIRDIKISKNKKYLNYHWKRNVFYKDKNILFDLSGSSSTTTKQTTK